MKRFLLSFLLLTASICINAQTVTGSLDGLFSQKYLNVIVDYSEASIHGMCEDDFSELETDWQKDKPSITAKVIANLSEKIGGRFIFGLKKPESYSLKIHVNSISIKGNFNFDVFILNADGKEEAKIEGFKAKGGTFGSALNLIGDGAEQTGKVIAKFLKSKIK